MKIVALTSCVGIYRSCCSARYQDVVYGFGWGFILASAFEVRGFGEAGCVDRLLWVISGDYSWYWDAFHAHRIIDNWRLGAYL